MALVRLKALELRDELRQPPDPTEPSDKGGLTRTVRAREGWLALLCDYELRVIRIGTKTVPFEAVRWWEEEAPREEANLPKPSLQTPAKDDGVVKNQPNVIAPRNQQADEQMKRNQQRRR